MGNQFSFKELYDVVLKAKFPMSIGGRNIEPGEVISYFDKIDIANFQEVNKQVEAHGGYHNAALVTWTWTEQLNLTFAQGIFDKEQFALMHNAKIISEVDKKTTLSQREFVETNMLGHVILQHEPLLDKPIYMYRKSGEKCELSSSLRVEKFGNEGWMLLCSGPRFEDVVVDYSFEQTVGTEMVFGRELFQAAVELEGRTRVQEDISGNFRTAIIKIPK